MSTATRTLPRVQSARTLWVPLLVQAAWLAGAALGIAALIWTWQLTAVPVQVSVDGLEETVYTHRRTVRDLLLDLNLILHPADRISLPLDARLSPHTALEIQRAPVVRLQADGRHLELHTWAATPREVLQEARIPFTEYDRVAVGAHTLDLDDPLSFPLPERLAMTYDRGHAWDTLAPAPLEMYVLRAIPIQVDDGNVPFTVHTTAQTVGEALREAEITLYLGDRVQPSLGSPVSTGLRVTIERSTPVSLQVDGRRLKTRTRGKTVGDALAEIGVVISGLDEVSPPLETPLYDNVDIRVTRVQEEIVIEEDVVPFETVFVPDPNLLIDTQQVVNPGAEGITRRRYRVRYEDGQEVKRVLEDTWVAQEPAQRVIAYGQKIVPRTAVTPDGQEITYWRKIRMLASSYSASTAGVSPDAPWYGITRTGEPMRKGVVAVDPRIVPLRTQVYVPGYGFGQALDTGSAIQARRIDLGYDDHNLVLWNRWVDVYLLWPPPPSYLITWVLPNWPPER